MKAKQIISLGIAIPSLLAAIMQPAVEAGFIVQLIAVAVLFGLMTWNGLFSEEASNVR